MIGYTFGMELLCSKCPFTRFIWNETNVEAPLQEGLVHPITNQKEKIMFICRECGKKKEYKVPKYMWMFAISYGPCEICKETKETVDWHGYK